MKSRRLGKFRFQDYCVSWISIVLLLLFSTVSITLKSSFLFVIFPAMYAVIWLGIILVPYREKFIIGSDAITIFLGNKTQTIFLPSELTLVVSYVDVCPPLTMRTAGGNQTHILKNKFAISVLRKISVEDTLEALHRTRLQKYTNSRIRTIFDDYHYIYSFVGDQSLFNMLIANRKYQLILPESLSRVISYESSIENVHIDLGY